jgi:hypothetical protein
MRTKYLVAGLVLAALPLAGLTVPEEGVFYWWQHSGLDVRGNPEKLVKVEYAIALEAEDLNTQPSVIVKRRTDPVNGWEQKLLEGGISQETVTRLKDVDKAYSADLDASFRSDLTPGETYRIWCRVADAAENWSTWVASDPWVQKDILPPKPPPRVSCEGCGD